MNTPTDTAPNPSPAPASNAAGGGKPSPKGPSVIQIRPLAQAAGLKRRHRGLVVSFLALVITPLLITMLYLGFVAQDQYASTTGFTVRREEMGGATDLLGNLKQFTGGGGASDSDILYEFIRSQEVVQTIDDRLNLREIYSQNWPGDPLFSLWPDASIEDLLWFWQRMVQISYDQSTGLIELRVLAYSPEMAQTIGKEIVVESQNRINILNATARSDMMRYAETDLAEAVERLKAAREAMTLFRTRTQIVDPSADIQGQMGVVNNLQQQLAQALIDYDLLIETSSDTDPRVKQSARRIEVIRSRIAQERETFASEKVGGVGEDYPTLMAQYESLIVDREYASESYRAALAAVDIARANIARQSRYLAAYVNPTLPQTAEYPQRLVLTGLVALFLLLGWSIMVLVYYSLRDRR